MEVSQYQNALGDTSANDAQPTLVTFAISDPEVLAALAEYPEGPARTAFIVTALKVGVLSLKVARGTIDADAVRKEGEWLVESLGTRLNGWREKFEERVSGSLARYFDPQQGTFIDRVNRLTHADGDLAAVIRQQVKEAEGNLSRVFDQFIGENSQLIKSLDPSDENQLILTMQRTLDGVVQAQNAAILNQFSLDNKESALVRFMGELTAKHGDLNKALSQDMQAVVAEFSLDKEDSALSRLVARVEAAQRSLNSELSLDNEHSALKRMYKMLEEHQKDVLKNQMELASKLDSAVQALQARREEAAKSTRHGIEFEAALGAHLLSTVPATGDVIQEVGATTGRISNCKVGDHVITVGQDKIAAGARIVVEAKEHASYDLGRTLAEADLARRNRDAGVCIFVHSRKTADSTIPEFARHGRDIVVQWEADDERHDVWLRAALMVATAVSTNAAAREKDEAASFEKIDKAIERIRKQIGDCEEMRTFATTAKKSAIKIIERTEIMEEDLTKNIESIAAEFLKIKAAGLSDE